MGSNVPQQVEGSQDAPQVLPSQGFLLYLYPGRLPLSCCCCVYTPYFQFSTLPLVPSISSIFIHSFHTSTTLPATLGGFSSSHKLIFVFLFSHIFLLPLFTPLPWTLTACSVLKPTPDDFQLPRTLFLQPLFLTHPPAPTEKSITESWPSSLPPPPAFSSYPHPESSQSPSLSPSLLSPPLCLTSTTFLDPPNSKMLPSLPTDGPFGPPLSRSIRLLLLSLHMGEGAAVLSCWCQTPSVIFWFHVALPHCEVISWTSQLLQWDFKTMKLQMQQFFPIHLHFNISLQMPWM